MAWPGALCECVAFCASWPACSRARLSFPAALSPPVSSKQDIGGTWDEAVALHFGPGNRMYVVERKGRVWIVENGVRQPQPFVDISDEVGGWRDYGLLGFALHPNFTANGYVYLLYVVDTHHLLTGGDPANGYDPARNIYFDATIGRITRYTADPANDRKTVLPESRFVLLGETASTGFPLLYQSHGAGSLVFGMDGTLMASAGDGACYLHYDQGSDADTYFQHGLDYGIMGADQNIGGLRSQYLGSLSGKLLRLDPETGDGLPSNPFWDPANPRSARSRTWALGLRNPYRFSLKPGSGSHNPADANPGTFFLGDAGWNSSEDFHVIDRPGLNLGWPIFEGMVPRYPGNVPNRRHPTLSTASGAARSSSSTSWISSSRRATTPSPSRIPATPRSRSPAPGPTAGDRRGATSSSSTRAPRSPGGASPGPRPSTRAGRPRRAK